MFRGCMFILFASSLFVGCSGESSKDCADGGKSAAKELDPEKDFIGLWKSDAEASKAKWGDDEQLVRRMTGQLKTEWEYKSDNKFVVSKGERKYTGTWTIKSKDKTQVQIELKADDDPTDKRVVFTLVFEGTDRFVYTSSEAPGELVMVRQQ